MSVQLQNGYCRVDNSLKDHYKVDVVRDYISFKELKDDWNRLAGYDKTLYPFICFEWFDLWFRSFNKTEVMYICLLRDSSGICAIMPLISYHAFYRGVKGKILQLAVNDHSQKIEILSDKKNIPLYVEELMRALINENPMIIYFEDLLEDSETTRHIQKFLWENYDLTYGIKYVRESVFLDIEPGWDIFSKTLPRKFRKNINNNKNKVSRSNRTQVVTYTRPEDVETAFDCINKICSESWQGKNGTGMLSGVETSKFYRDLAEHAAREGWLSIWVLYFNDIPVAYEYHLTIGPVDYALKSEYDQNHSCLSPGCVLDAFVVQELAQRKLKRYDLLGYKESFKTRWSRKTERYVRIYVFNDEIKGRLCYFIDFRFLERLRKNRLVSQLRAFF